MKNTILFLAVIFPLCFLRAEDQQAPLVVHEWGTFTSLQDEGGNAIGGIKVIAENGWFAARPSGTEDVYKIYAETFRGPEHLKKIQEEAQAMVGAVLDAGALKLSAP